ncbi:MAG: hypothetical protein H6855_03095 [Rhodospirillales bacterium]|nr:hypothetical protein [Rhodospirillales bacterium]MCB9980375.1 hypothetical protein [Rhodospirillales bacterium]
MALSRIAEEFGDKSGVQKKKTFSEILDALIQGTGFSYQDSFFCEPSRSWLETIWKNEIPVPLRTKTNAEHFRSCVQDLLPDFTVFPIQEAQEKVLADIVMRIFGETSYFSSDTPFNLEAGPDNEAGHGWRIDVGGRPLIRLDLHPKARRIRLPYDGESPGVCSFQVMDRLRLEVDPLQEITLASNRHVPVQFHLSANRSLVCVSPRDERELTATVTEIARCAIAQVKEIIQDRDQTPGLSGPGG